MHLLKLILLARTIIIIIVFYDIFFFLPIMLSKVNFVNYLNLL